MCVVFCGYLATVSVKLVVIQLRKVVSEWLYSRVVLMLITSILARRNIVFRLWLLLLYYAVFRFTYIRCYFVVDSNKRHCLACEKNSYWGCDTLNWTPGRQEKSAFVNSPSLCDPCITGWRTRMKHWTQVQRSVAQFADRKQQSKLDGASFLTDTGYDTSVVIITHLIRVNSSSHWTRAQIRCCLNAVWILPFTSTGPICLRCACSSCVGGWGLEFDSVTSGMFWTTSELT